MRDKTFRTERGLAAALVAAIWMLGAGSAQAYVECQVGAFSPTGVLLQDWSFFDGERVGASRNTEPVRSDETCARCFVGVRRDLGFFCTGPATDEVRAVCHTSDGRRHTRLIPCS